MMLGIAEISGWLNYEDPGKLSVNDKLSFQQLYDPAIPPAQKEGALKIIKLDAETCPDELEKAELMVNLGKYFDHIKNFEEAVTYLNAGVKLYDPDTHRYAIANWMRGIVFWKTIDSIKAHANWRIAVRIFESLRDQSRVAKNPDKVNWYNERIEKMNIQITQTAEEAYNWLYKWDVSSLDSQVKVFVREIEARINQHDYSAAYEIGLGLSRISRLRLNPAESAETNIVIGMQYLRMGQAKMAINQLQRAGASFTPGNYQQAVTKWMLGVAQWELSNERDHAFKSWRDAIDLFREVMSEADRNNDQDKRIWIENQINLMQMALDEKARELLINI